MAEKDAEKTPEQEEQEALLARFPTAPPAPEIPEPPKIAVTLPMHPAKPKPGTVEPGSYNKMALAFTAATSFIMPIILLTLGGYFLDGKLHTSPWLVFLGVLVGLGVGVSSLLRIVNRLSG